VTDLVIYEVDGAVATITLNRPDKYNAINWEMVDGLDEAFDAAAADEAVKAVVLAANGKHF
jgi:enoyl-CoA hydratase